MPHQNLESEILLAIGMWLLEIFVFATVILAAIVQLINENRTKAKSRQSRKQRPLRKYTSQSRGNFPAKEQ